MAAAGGQGGLAESPEERSDRFVFIQTWHGAGEDERDSLAGRYALKLALRGVSPSQLEAKLLSCRLPEAYVRNLVEWVGAQWSFAGRRFAEQCVAGLAICAGGLAATVYTAETLSGEDRTAGIFFYGAVFGGPILTARELWRGRQPFAFYLGLLKWRRARKVALFGSQAHATGRIWATQGALAVVVAGLVGTLWRVGWL